jgi:hypothetical protein
VFERDFVGLLGEMQYLGSVLSSVEMDIPTVVKTITSIQCHLLLHQSGGSENSPNATLEEICRVGCLVYLQTIYNFHLYLQLRIHPIDTVTNGGLIPKLKYFLNMAEINTAQTRALLLWIMFLGGAEVPGTKDRACYGIEYLHLGGCQIFTYGISLG